MAKTHFGILYGNIGNVEMPDIERRRATKVGLVTSQNIVLKMYSMLKKSPEDFSERIQEAKGFLEKEITEGKIEPLSGMGFAIFSENRLNVSRWDSKQPLVVVNQVYSYDGNFTPINISEAGSFCIYELVIVASERAAWERFLRSHRDSEDKKRYLNSWFEGEIR
ncbi:MAG: hypothetical protein QXF25_00310 [Candidatus Pacearchaeota archaeon]